jgi:thioredoxin 1
MRLTAARPRPRLEPRRVRHDESRNDVQRAKTVTDATFQSEVLHHEIPILVDFWAEWCGPCRAVSPILDKIAEENTGKLSIVKMNVDENPETAEKYGIVSIPSMLVFDGGEVVKRITGAKPRPVLDADLTEFLA